MREGFVHKRTIAINASSTVIQIIISAVTLFVLYKFLLNTIGVSMVGIWSLVIATTSIARIGNLGMTGSLVKYVAKYDALNDIHSISSVVQTAVISGGLCSTIFVCVAYPAAKEYLRIVIKPELYPIAIEILPYTIIAFWISLITSMYQAGLYGCHMIAQQNTVLIGDSIIYLLICYLVIPTYGLLGLVFCRMFVNCVTFTITLMLLKKRISGLPIVPYKWDKKSFQEMIRYASNFQIIIILGLLCDPVTKGLLSKFGSVSMVGYFEMASKVVQQLRSLFVNAYQVLIPAFANLKELGPHMISAAYVDSYRLLFYITLPVFSVCAIATPLISVAWIGSYQPIFVWSALILIGGWFFNTLGIPAYYAYLGIGDMRWNVISHGAMSILNLLFGLIFAEIWGGFGVVAAWAVSLFFGGIIPNISYNLKNDIALGELFPASSRPLAVFSLLGFAVSYAVYYAGMCVFKESVGNGIMVFCFALTIGIPLWIHPLRKECQRWLAMIVSKRPVT